MKFTKDLTDEEVTAGSGAHLLRLKDT